MANLERIWSPETSLVADLLARENFETRTVGGPVRDTLLGVAAHDLDLCTTATPERMLEIAFRSGLRTIPTWSQVMANPQEMNRGGLKHGTVPFVVNGITVDVTTLRHDMVTDGRHADVIFVTDFKSDARRRDFTINAMSVDRAGTLYDYFGGRQDLEDGIVRFVGNPDERIREDYLRILRYYRFSARFGEHNSSLKRVQTADIATKNAILRNAHGLASLSGERIWQEMSRIFSMPSAVSVQLADMSSGVAAVIGLPVRPGATLLADKAAKSGARPEIVLGFLLARILPHDFDTQPNVTGESLQKFWKFSNEETQLVELARTNADMANKPLNEFRAMAVQPRANLDHVKALLTGFGRGNEFDHLVKSLVDFPLKGKDLLAHGIKAGPELGANLSVLRERWIKSNYVADAQELLETLGNNIKGP